MSEIIDKVKFNLSVQDVFVMGSAIVTITASFLWLRADLLVLTTKFESFKGNIADNVKKIEEEQTKMSSTLDSIYYEVKQWRDEDTRIAHMERNTEKRLRVGRVDVMIQFDSPADSLEHLDRVLAQFEDFCVVPQSVRSGFPVSVTVRDGSGKVIKPE